MSRPSPAPPGSPIGRKSDFTIFGTAISLLSLIEHGSRHAAIQLRHRHPQSVVRLRSPLNLRLGQNPLRTVAVAATGAVAQETGKVGMHELGRGGWTEPSPLGLGALLVMPVDRSPAGATRLRLCRGNALDPLHWPGNHQGAPLPQDSSNPITDAYDRAVFSIPGPLQNRAARTDELDKVMRPQCIVLHEDVIGPRCRPVEGQGVARSADTRT